MTASAALAIGEAVSVFGSRLRRLPSSGRGKPRPPNESHCTPIAYAIISVRLSCLGFRYRTANAVPRC